MKLSVDESLCTYEASEHEHVFIFKDSSRSAVTTWAHHIEQLQVANQWYNHDTVRLLLDARQADELPIRYLLEMLSDYNRPYPDLYPPKVVIAYLHEPRTLILSIYTMFAEALHAKIGFFTQESQAHEWLAQSH